MTDTNETKVEVTLKSCPFCGGDAEIWRAHPENPKRNAWIACMDRCAVMTKEYPTNAEAITAWNTRIQAEKRTAPRDAVTDAMAEAAWQAYNTSTKPAPFNRVRDAVQAAFLAALDGDE